MQNSMETCQVQSRNELNPENRLSYQHGRHNKSVLYSEVKGRKNSQRSIFESVSCPVYSPLLFFLLWRKNITKLGTYHVVPAKILWLAANHITLVKFYLFFKNGLSLDFTDNFWQRHPVVFVGAFFFCV